MMKIIWLVGLVAACGADGPSYLKPPAEAVASCKLVEKRAGSVRREALWFDSAGRTIQSDGYDGSCTYDYDDQGRLVAANTTRGTITWTYAPTRITQATSSYTEAYDLGSDGRVTRVEDPPDSFPQDVVDFTYDAAGHITSEIGMHYEDSAHAPTTANEHRFTYDAQGRLTSAFWNSTPTGEPTSYTYTEMPGFLTIQLGGALGNVVYSYAFDASNRIVHASVEQSNVLLSGDAYSYGDNTITALADGGGYEVDATGACPPLTTAFAPPDPLPITMSNLNIELPNPPVDDFNEGLY